LEYSIAVPDLLHPRPAVQESVTNAPTQEARRGWRFPRGPAGSSRLTGRLYSFFHPAIGGLPYFLPGTVVVFYVTESEASKTCGRQRRDNDDRGSTMNWDQVQGKWKQYKGKAKERWGQFTDDDLETIDGRAQQLVGKIQERYGVEKEAAEKQADEFLKSLDTDTTQGRKQDEKQYRAAGR
jgi:uncharacterized protein YjbJ (UPF0337 family)